MYPKNLRFDYFLDLSGNSCLKIDNPQIFKKFHSKKILTYKCRETSTVLSIIFRVVFKLRTLPNCYSDFLFPLSEINSNFSFSYLDTLKIIKIILKEENIRFEIQTKIFEELELMIYQKGLMASIHPNFSKKLIIPKKIEEGEKKKFKLTEDQINNTKFDFDTIIQFVMLKFSEMMENRISNLIAEFYLNCRSDHSCRMTHSNFVSTVIFPPPIC